MEKSKKPVEILINKFTKSVALPFQEILPSQIIEEVIDELGIKYRNRLYNPIVTIWSFLSQVLDTDHSCKNAVSRIIAYLVGENQERPSEDTGAYCKARKKLPERLFKKLLDRSSQNLENQVDKKSLWHGRHVKSIDGSTVSMPDTVENQKAYPQHPSQKIGCGFPLAAIGVLFSYCTGAVMGIVIDTWSTHDINLARQLTKYLEVGDILLGDRAFCAFTDICLWMKQGCDLVARLHQGRVTKGKKKTKYTVIEDSKHKKTKRKRSRKSPHDRLILWEKPKIKPEDISQEDFDSVPKELVLREVHAYICIPGFRTKEIIVVTTLLDAIEYPAHDILQLYDERWEAEINLKHIKTTLGMDILSCKTPAMVRKEIYTYLLAYNLLRTIMYQAGTLFNKEPVRLSLQAARQHLGNFTPELTHKTKVRGQKIYTIMLETVADSYQKPRVGRVEPRVKKRRPKAYPLMQEPRQVLRAKMKAA